MASSRKRKATIEKIDQLRLRFLQGLVTEETFNNFLTRSSNYLAGLYHREYINASYSLIYPADIEDFIDLLRMMEARYVLLELGLQKYYTTCKYSNKNGVEIYVLTATNSSDVYGIINCTRKGKMSLGYVNMDRMDDFEKNPEPIPLSSIAYSLGIEAPCFC